MDSGLSVFQDSTKHICTCSFASMIIIILFVVSPLNKFFMISVFMKIVSLAILGYTIYLNTIQTNLLRASSEKSTSPELSSYLSTNIICSYTFTLFLGLLMIFVIKSFL